MEDRTFILPTDDEDGQIAALVTLTEEAMKTLARMRTDINAEREEVVARTYSGLPGAVFRIFKLSLTAELNDDEVDMFNEVFKCSSAYMLGSPIRPEICETWDTPLYAVSVHRGVVNFEFDCVTSTVTWNELGVDPEDLVRCWFNDCPDEHPAARGSELVTCHTCRKEMGL